MRMQTSIAFKLRKKNQQKNEVTSLILIFRPSPRRSDPVLTQIRTYSNHFGACILGPFLLSHETKRKAETLELCVCGILRNTQKGVRARVLTGVPLFIAPMRPKLCRPKAKVFL